MSLIPYSLPLCGVGNEDKRPTYSQYYRSDLMVSRPEIDKQKQP